MKPASKAAIIIGFTGVLLFTGLLLGKQLSEASYVILLSITALISIVVHGFSRIKELDLKNLKLTLEKLEETEWKVADLEFSQGVIKSQFESARRRGFRFEDIQEEKNTEKHLPELREIADEYLRISVSDWSERIRLKNEAAVDMAAYVLSNRLSKKILSEDANEGVLLALAGAMYSKPESSDFQLIKGIYKKISRLHVRWRIVAVIELMLTARLIGRKDEEGIREILEHFSINADKPLRRKIEKTLKLLEEIISNKANSADAKSRAAD